MENINQHEEETLLTDEQVREKREEMLKFYTESLSYLHAQYEYEKKLMEIDEVRFKRAQFQMQYAMMMAPPSEEEDDAPVQAEEKKGKK